MAELVHALVGRQLQDEDGQDDRDDERDETKAHQLVGDNAAMEFRDGAGYGDQRQERENPRFDGQRPERDLFRTQKAAERNHAAVQDREEKQGRGDSARRGLFHRRAIVGFAGAGKSEKRAAPRAPCPTAKAR